MDVDSGNAEPGKYVLTGSSGFRLKENITDSLAGRIGLIKLLPFSLSEIKNNTALEKDPYHYVFNGFYPPLYDDRKNFKPFDWFSNYIDTYLDLDVRENINNSNISLFRKFMTLCATYSGKLVNYDAISNDLGISSVTIKSWMSILENSFIITFLEPDLNNLGKSLVKTPKLYFTDTGLLCHLLRIKAREDLMLSPYKGAIVETMAVIELLKHRHNNSLKPDLSFFRDKNGLEVDIIASWDAPFAIEVKSNSMSDKKLSSHLRKYLALANNPNLKGKVFYLGDFSIPLEGIEYVGWQDWGGIEN
ncbi:MAG TPA: ATPase [Spirochaetaceae bacterium]|nr:ATPase [Spirochaetaceae bacterium]